MKSEEIKPVLLVSASDSSAAAGMQMDLRVLCHLGVPARCAVTAVTVQGDGGAAGISPTDPHIIADSIKTALSDKPGVGAVKVGLLCDPFTADILEDALRVLNALHIPIVIDPVIRSTPGSDLSREGTPRAILEKLLPWATLLTPNRHELDTLAGFSGLSGADEKVKVGELLSKGVRAVLVTGGDTDEALCLDTLYESGGRITEISHPRIGDRPPRGTGCALSTCIAAHMGIGISLPEAVGRSVEYVTGLIERAREVGDQLLLLPGKEGSGF